MRASQWDDFVRHLDVDVGVVVYRRTMRECETATSRYLSVSNLRQAYGMLPDDVWSIDLPEDASEEEIDRIIEIDRYLNSRIRRTA